MTESRPDFSELCAHAAGRRSARVEEWLARDPDLRAEYELARALVEAARDGRDVEGATPHGRRLAMRAFRERFATPPRVLVVVADSHAGRPAAVRTPTPALPRLLRLRGEGLAVLLHLSAGRRGLDLHGEIDPIDAADEIELAAGDRKWGTAVDANGEFRLRDLPRAAWSLRVGDHVLDSLEP